MEMFLIIVSIAVVIWMFNNIKDKLNFITYRLNELAKELKQLGTAQQTSSGKDVIKQIIPVQTIRPAIVPEAPKSEEIKKEIIPPSTPLEKLEEMKTIPKQEKVNLPPVFLPKSSSVAKPPEQTFWETFLKKNPDMEKFIGENLINKIGIAVLVLGISFFVKYAIDKDWINEIGRVAIGIFCGGILLGIAHYLRKRFAAFSSVMVGGGIAVLYFTIAIAFHQYQLLNQTATFSIMVVITAFTVVLSIGYNRIELAVLGILGGFITPFMVSTGEGNYIVLFTYILILNGGMIVLAYFKKWNLLNIICYIFTILLYGSWLMSKVIGVTGAPYQGAFIFGTAFYLGFFIMNIVNNVKQSRKFNALEISLLLSNTFLYFTAGMRILQNIHHGDLQGLFTALMAVFNFIFVFSLYKRQNVDKNLSYLLIGLVLTFLSLAAPIQLEGNYITLFWSLEAVLLLWLSQKSGIHLIKQGAVAVMFLMFISLLMDWEKIYLEGNSSGSMLMILLNKGFITSMVSVGSIYATLFLLKKETSKFILKKFETVWYKYILQVVLLIFLYVSFLLELRYQLDQHIAYSYSRQIILGCYNLGFAAAFMIFGRNKNERYIIDITSVIGVIALLGYLVFYNYTIFKVRNEWLTGQTASAWQFYFHYIDAMLTIFLVYLCFKNIKEHYQLKSNIGNFFPWFATFALVQIASSELIHLIVIGNYSPSPDFSIPSVTQQANKIGLPILWGICSFVLMIIGMKVKMKQLRIISLSLFFITLIKLFFFDIKGISEGGKIAAFISLGLILLIMSFMYQKLKTIILASDEAAKPNSASTNTNLPK